MGGVHVHNFENFFENNRLSFIQRIIIGDDVIIWSRVKGVEIKKERKIDRVHIH